MRYSLSIRYCGGCQAAYDRSALVREILEGLRSAGMEVDLDYSFDSAASVGLLVCGCMTQCLLREAGAIPGLHRLGPDLHYDNAPHSLEGIIALLGDELRAATRAGR